MGDIFFLIKMIFLTFVIVIIMQIKVGTTTLEEKVLQITHNSEFAAQIQQVAEGAAHFIGVSYNRISSQIDSDFMNQHKETQIPGKRLKAKMNEWKQDFQDRFKKNIDEQLKEQLQDTESAQKDL